MKKFLLFVFSVLMLVSLCGVVIGEEAKPVKPGGGKSAAKPSVRTKIRDRSSYGSSRQMGGREMMAARQNERMATEVERAMKTHKEFTTQLEAIKKLAEEEGAKKTAAKIQELIDKDKAKLKKMTADMKKRTEEFMKRMQGASGRDGKELIGGQRPPGSREGRGRGSDARDRGDEVRRGDAKKK